MKPEWYNVDSIPYRDMWEDDSIWCGFYVLVRPLNYNCFRLPRILNDDKAVLDWTFWFDTDVRLSKRRDNLAVKETAKSE